VSTQGGADVSLSGGPCVGSISEATQGYSRFVLTSPLRAGLFDSADVLRLTAPEIGLLVEVGRLDWRRIDPAIFGTLFERGLDRAQRTQLGAHYTRRDDIHARVVAAARDAEAAGSELDALSAVLW
jgi:hypothetical protein